MSGLIHFRVCTIVNRDDEYARMRASFSAGGFDAVSTYTLFDNREGNRHEPYRTLEQVIADTPEPYIIFCHQDVRLGEDATPERLLARLRDLDQVDPSWMVAGNAGFDSAGEPVLHLDSTDGNPRSLALPRRVFSLDENFLVLKARSGLTLSPELQGFHLYGTDLCLNAYKRRGAAYVVEFVVTHLGPGNAKSPEYMLALQAFEACWRGQLIVGLVRTTCTQSLLSSSPFFESLLPKYATVAQFLWDAQVILVFHRSRFRRLSRLAFMLLVIPASAVWRLCLRKSYLRLNIAPGALIRWNHSASRRDPKRILFVNMPIEFYSPKTGGAVSTIIAELARGLEQRGHEVTILTRTDGTPPHPHGRVVPLDPCGPEDLNFGQRQLHKLAWRLNRWDWPYFNYYRRAVRRAAKLLEKPPHVVVVFNDLLSPVFLRKLFRRRARVIVWLQNEQRTRARDLSAARAATWRWLTCSRYIRDWTLSHHGFEPEKVVAVPSGVNLQQFHPREGGLAPAGKEVRVLFVGRLSFDKGPDLAADAVAALRAEGCAVSLTVAGGRWFYPQPGEADDPFLAALRERLDHAGAVSLGHVSREDIGEVFRQHDVVCVLSRWNEPFGLVALEAMASGCAVVASDRGGLPEACGDGATLVDPDDPAAIRAALRRLVTDPAALAEAKSRAWRRAQAGSWETVVDRFEALIR